MCEAWWSVPVAVIEPTITRVVRNGTTLQALVLATRIAPGTLHLPQVAVHPARRREGLARRLVEEASPVSRGTRGETGNAARGGKQRQRGRSTRRWDLQIRPRSWRGRWCFRVRCQAVKRE